MKIKILAMNTEKILEHIEKYMLVNGEHIKPLTKKQRTKMSAYLKHSEKKFKESEIITDDVKVIPYEIVAQKIFYSYIGVGIFDTVEYEVPMPEEYYA